MKLINSSRRPKVLRSDQHNRADFGRRGLRTNKLSKKVRTVSAGVMEVSIVVSMRLSSSMVTSQSTIERLGASFDESTAVEVRWGSHKKVERWKSREVTLPLTIKETV